MRRALDLAGRGWGRTHPNPMVGAVLVAGNEVLAEGWHEQAGAAHAERVTLDQWPKPVPAEATLYVTLEPCSSTGRTPPCTDLILARGVPRLVYGAGDEDERHRGRGIEQLRKAGVEVVGGVLADEARDLNLLFHFRAATGRPLVAAKWAATLDGRTATRTGASRWITGEAAREDVHRWRRYFPAIGVGAGTVIEDDPQLTARLADEPVHCPLRLVFDASGRLAAHPERKVFTDSFADRTILVSRAEAGESLASSLPGIRRAILPPAGPDREWLAALLTAHGAPGLYLEGGARLHGDFLRRGLVDYLFAYRAPLLFLDQEAPGPACGLAPQTPAEGLRLREVHHALLGDDQLLRGFLEAPTESP
jgi:diaminohydroxyphosphoribosylaminopyrimidine deaminase/5-amino-6-(5-phosphoribosylamino)uracil reductase